MSYLKTASLSSIASVIFVVASQILLPEASQVALSPKAYAAPQAVSPEAPRPSGTCLCLPGSSCADYTIPLGKEPQCYTGVCNSLCACQAQALAEGSPLGEKILNLCADVPQVCINGRAESQPQNLIPTNDGSQCDLVSDDNNICSTRGCSHGSCIQDHPALRPPNNTVACAESVVTPCNRTDYRCADGECRANVTYTAPQTPEEKCQEATDENGHTRATKTSYSPDSDQCTWHESFTHQLKPADTCVLNESGDSLVKTGTRLNLQSCLYEQTQLPGYPKRKPTSCSLCEANVGLEVCDWIPVPYCGDKVVNQEKEECDGSSGLGAGQSCSADCLLVAAPTLPPPPPNTCPPLPEGCGLGCKAAPYPRCIECEQPCVTTPITYYTETGECLMATYWSGNSCCPEVGCDIKAHGYGDRREGESWYKNVQLSDACPSQRGMLIGEPIKCLTCDRCTEKLDCISETNAGDFVFVKDGYRPRYGHMEGGEDQCWCVPKKDACPSGYHPRSEAPEIKYTPLRDTGLLNGTACLNRQPESVRR